jgi:multiple sugar transport system permease protein
MALPRELDEAARIDGCTTFDTYWRIALPLVKPALAVVTIIQTQHTWTDFFGPLIYLNSPDKFTLALGLYSLQSQVLQGDVPEDMLMALAVLMVLPIAIVFLVAQRQITRSAVFTGLQG